MWIESLTLKYYLPQCKYCQLLDPEFDPLRGLFPDLEILHINGAEVRTSVKRFPTVKILDKDVEITYKGPRTTQSLVEFVCNYTGDPVPKPVYSFVVATDSIPLDRDSIVVFSASWIDGWSNPYKLYYNELAQLYGDVSFVYVDASVSTELVSRFRVSRFPSLFSIQSGTVSKVEGIVTRELIVLLVEGRVETQEVIFSEEEKAEGEDDDVDDEDDFSFYRDL